MLLHIDIYIYIYITYTHIYDPVSGRLCPFRGGAALAATRLQQRHSMGGGDFSSQKCVLFIGSSGSCHDEIAM